MNERPTNLLILGCGGFIGSHLIARLVGDPGYRITGVDQSEYKIREHLGRFDFRCRDIYADEAVLDREIADSDAVLFLASVCNPSLYVRDPVETIRSNFSRPSRIVDLCAHHGTWLIACSTCEVYGRTLASYVDPDYANPAFYLQQEADTPSVLGPLQNTRWSYAAAKQLLDRYIHAMHLQQNLPFTLIRPYNFFGPRMDYLPDAWNSGVPRVLASFMDALIRGKPIQLVDGGSAYRTITYIDDAIDALVRVLERRDKACGQLFNIGNPANETTVEGMARKMRDLYADITGDSAARHHPIESVSGRDFYGAGYEDCDRRVPDISKARALLGWEPRYGLDETLALAVRFFLQFQGIPPTACAPEPAA